MLKDKSCFLQPVDGVARRRMHKVINLGMLALLVICSGLSEQIADAKGQVSHYEKWKLKHKKGDRVS